MKAMFPIVYNGYSTVLGETCFLIVVNSPGKFYYYEANAECHPIASWSDSTKGSLHIYDDPKVGLTYMPVSSINTMQIVVQVIERATDEQISALLRSLKSITVEEVRTALANLNQT